MRQTVSWKITYGGIFTALAMIFSYIESMIPIPVPIPGIKLGIANIAVTTILYVLGSVPAGIINLLRIVLTAVLFGNLNSFLFSISGGILSILVMIVLRKTNVFSMMGVSIAGGVSHNIGQIIVAVILMQTTAIYYYMPVLILAGILTGAVIGIVSALVTARVTSVVKA